MMNAPWRTLCFAKHGHGGWRFRTSSFRSSCFCVTRFFLWKKGDAWCGEKKYPMFVHRHRHRALNLLNVGPVHRHGSPPGCPSAVPKNALEVFVEGNGDQSKLAPAHLPSRAGADDHFEDATIPGC